MKAQSQPSQTDPKEKGNSQSDGNNNDGPSRPKDPNNDPDQTPDREVKNPPQADPGKRNGPGQNQDSPAYK